jgi:16S rRNA (guanine1516-N2)-methyltransferase
MGLTLLRGGTVLPADNRQYSELNKFCSDYSRDLTFEWIDGQFWLHSDRPGERPIGLALDAELARHEAYFKQAGLRSELLARAIGVKGVVRPRVLDLTAGMLADSLLFLSFGCEVWAVERHPVIRFLILSAMQNARHPRLRQLHFIAGDAGSVLAEAPAVDTVYFDPMFEDANERTAPKKEMRIFRDIVGKDADAAVVFRRALELRPKRLVVKRPRHSAPLAGPPATEYIGKSTRYDVYFSL